MRSSIICMLAAAASAFACAGYYAAYGSPLDTKLYSVCEAALKARLRSPAGYERVSVSQSKHELTRSEYFDVLTKDGESPSVIEALIRNFGLYGPKPVRFDVALVYDAPNGFGAPTRGAADCSYTDPRGDSSTANPYIVRINGMTTSEWLLDQARELQN